MKHTSSHTLQRVDVPSFNLFPPFLVPAPESGDRDFLLAGEGEIFEIVGAFLDAIGVSSLCEGRPHADRNGAFVDNAVLRKSGIVG